VTRTLQAVLEAEVRKLVGLRSIWGSAAFALLVAPLLAVANSASLRAALSSGHTDQLVSTSTVDSGFVEVTLAMIAAIIVGVVAMSSEYHTSRGTDSIGPQITTTLAATPRRHVLLVAKALAIGLVVAPLGALSTVLTIAASRLGLGSYAVPLDASITARGAGAVLCWVLTAEIAFAVTVIVRNGVIPLVVGIANSSVISISFMLSKLTRWAAYLPDAAGAQLFIREYQTADRLAPAAGGVAMALWAIAVLSIASTLFNRRDT
jgi:ABC-2 type transport system permease protein